jgi:putative addiction module killer protein
VEYELQTTQIFSQWFRKLDNSTRIILLERLDRISTGNFGDYKTIGNNLFELRCFFSGGIRLYFTIRHQNIILLLIGGNKSSQARDIKKAVTIFNNLEI